MFVLSAAALVLAIVSRHMKSEGLWLAAVALGMMSVPLFPYVLAALYVKDGWPYEAALGMGAFTTLFLVILLAMGAAGARLASSK